MNIDIIFQIAETQTHPETEIKVFSKQDAFLKIKAASLDEGLKIADKEKASLLEAMSAYEPKKDRQKMTVNEADAAMRAYLKTDKGRRLTRSFEISKALAHKQEAGLKVSECQYLRWKITTGALFSALSDAFNIGFKRGYTKRNTRTRKKSA